MSVKDYKELDVYRLAFDATMEIFVISKTFHQEEKYSLTDQIRRSSRSVCANIAEAWRKRRYEAAFVSKLSDAEAEAAATEVWLDLSFKCGYIQEAVHKKLKDKYDHICRQLYIMMNDAFSWCLFASLNASRSTLSAPRASCNAQRSPLSAQRAFTLVELMVVVAVVAIMLMLLVPNIRSMRERASTTHCQNNLRQYGIAMNQYMADNSGFFIYKGYGVGDAVDGSTWHGSTVGDFGRFDNRARLGGTVGGAAPHNWLDHFISAGYAGPSVKLDSLAAGIPSVRVCPIVLRDLHKANYFDPRSPKFKGYRRYYDTILGQDIDVGDFENSDGAGYDAAGNPMPDTYLDSAFTTYAINMESLVYRKSKKDIPERVIAFIDWNARDGWGADLRYPTWQFSGTNSAGVAVTQGSSKWTNAWWVTEVGFHHLVGKEYGANYAAMDGHVGWISSNAISRASFTNGVSGY